MKNKLLKLLEDMPLGVSSRLKIGENEYALKQFQKQDKSYTMQHIKDWNNRSEGYEEGYRAAIDKLKEWRNEQYLILKELK